MSVSLVSAALATVMLKRKISTIESSIVVFLISLPPVLVIYSYEQIININFFGDVMDIKNILLISMFLMIIFSSLTIVSATESGSDGLIPTNIATDFGQNEDGSKYVAIQVYGQEENNSAFTFLTNETIYVNLTDEEGNVETYTLVTDKMGNFGDKCEARLDIEPGNYNLSVFFPGNDKFNSSSYTHKLNIAGPDGKVPSSNTQDTNVSDSNVNTGSSEIEYNSEDDPFRYVRHVDLEDPLSTSLGG